LNESWSGTERIASEFSLLGLFSHIERGNEPLIDLIRKRFRRTEYEYSLHALDQSIQRRISTGEVEEAVEAGEIIESYPSDKYGPSCLIFGLTAAGRPLHIQCTAPARNPVKVITLYQPEPSHWSDFRSRRLQ
jgi:hypothetical protein